ncbi:FAD:protein FMN transferase [Candidatus Latescibacterota bacterium]
MNYKPGKELSGIKRYCCAVSIVVLLLVLGFISGGWFHRSPKRLSATNYLMDTSVTLTVYAMSKQEGELAIRKAFEEGARVERIMEARKGDGELKRINNDPGNSLRTVSDDLMTVLARSRHFYDESGGAFDPSIAKVKWLWDFEEKRTVPDEGEIREKLKATGFQKIEIDNSGILFTNPDTRLDLGGVAKGYAVDRIIAVLKKNGIQAGLVNAGGDIATFGKKPGGKDWEIGISHPRLSRLIRIRNIPLRAVATSGDYQRFFIQDGQRYHHILDPSTGYPAHDCISVTVWAKSAMDADALATAVFVLGPEKGLALIERLDDTETLIFYKEDDKVEALTSSGVKDNIKL